MPENVLPLSSSELEQLKSYFERLLDYQISQNPDEQSGESESVEPELLSSYELSMFEIEEGAESGLQPKVLSSNVFTHSFTDWNPAAFNSGIDTFTVKIPPGYKYSNYQVARGKRSLTSMIDPTGPRPMKDATGKVKVKASWNILGTGSINYRMRVFCVPTDLPSNMSLEYTNTEEWLDLARQLLTQKKPFSIKIPGELGYGLWTFVRTFTGESASESSSSDTEIDPLTAVIAITGIVATTVAVVYSAEKFSEILLAAVGAGCTVDSIFNPGKEGGFMKISLNECFK